MRGALAAAFTLALIATSAHARPPKDAEQAFIETIYDHYLAEQRAEKTGEEPVHVDSLDEIEKRASLSLKKALKLENRCVMKTQEVCAIDADIAINAQDWIIRDVKVNVLSPEHEDEKTIRANFVNIDRITQVDYFFIRENDAWKVDEVEARVLNTDGTINQDYTWRLKETILKTLKRFRESRALFLRRAQI